jgi:hypothetical protein
MKRYIHHNLKHGSTLNNIKILFKIAMYKVNVLLF